MNAPKQHPPHTSTSSPDSRKGWNWSPGSLSPSLQPLCQPHVLVSLHFLVFPSLLTELLGFTHLLQNGRLSLPVLAPQTAQSLGASIPIFLERGPDCSSSPGLIS